MCANNKTPCTCPHIWTQAGTQTNNIWLCTYDMAPKLALNWCSYSWNSIQTGTHTHDTVLIHSWHCTHTHNIVLVSIHIAKYSYLHSYWYSCSWHCTSQTNDILLTLTLLSLYPNTWLSTHTWTQLVLIIMTLYSHYKGAIQTVAKWYPPVIFSIFTNICDSKFQFQNSTNSSFEMNNEIFFPTQLKLNLFLNCF